MLRERMSIPDYIILAEFKDEENIFIISKKFEIKDNVYLLKYSGSSFLYPVILLRNEMISLCNLF